MSALNIRLRLPELNAEITASASRLPAPSPSEPSPTRSDEPTTMDRADTESPAALGDAYPYVIRRPRLSRYY